METLSREGVEYVVYFHNPNIHPHDEYLRRKDECARFAVVVGARFVDGDYDHTFWLEGVRGLESEPERGLRCAACFEMRLTAAAVYAAANGFDLLTSSLAMSRWKDFDQVTACGTRAASRHPGLTYWTINWRKGGRQQLMSELVRTWSIYQQDYCGCEHSPRNAAHLTGKSK